MIFWVCLDKLLEIEFFFFNSVLKICVKNYIKMFGKICSLKLLFRCELQKRTVKVLILIILFYHIWSNSITFSFPKANINHKPIKKKKNINHK